MPHVDPSAKPGQSARLIRWRQARGLSQAQLAEYLGVTRVAIGYWEQGRTKIGHERMLSLALRHWDCLHASDASVQPERHS